MESVDARIGSSSFISGRIEGEGNLIIEGRVEGSIIIKGDLQIEAGAQVKSSVQARNVVVMGLLVGDAVATERVELAPSGRMIGDIRAPRFMISEGAAFRGKVDMVEYPLTDRPTDQARSSRPVTRATQQQTTRPAPTSSLPPRRVEPRREPTRPPLQGARPVNTPAPVPVGVGVSSSPPSPSQTASTAPRPAGTLYTPPPLPRPPEAGGARKAIIIKKKTNDGS